MTRGIRGLDDWSLACKSLSNPNAMLKSCLLSCYKKKKKGKNAALKQTAHFDFAGEGRIVMLIITDRLSMESPEATQLTSTDASLFIAGELRKEKKTKRQASQVGNKGTEGY